MFIVELYLHLPLIFFIAGKVNLFKWNVRTSGSLLSSVCIFAFEDYLHLSHL